MTLARKIPDLLLIGLGLFLPLTILLLDPTIELRPALRFGVIWGSAIIAFLAFEFVFMRRFQNPFFVFVGAVAFTLIAFGHWSTVSMVGLQWLAVMGLGMRLARHVWRSEDMTLAVIIGLTAYTLINTTLNYFKLISLSQSLILHAGLIALIPWKSVLDPWAKSAKVRKIERSERSLSYAVLCGLALGMGIGWAILTSVPDNGSDTIAAYRGMLIEVTRLGGNIYNPQETSIGLLSLPPLWNQAVSVVLSAGDLHAAKIWSSSVAIASVFVMSKLPVQAKTETEKLERDKSDIALDHIGFVLALFICATPVVSRLILSPFIDIAALFMSAGALYMFKVFIVNGQILTKRRAVCLGSVIALWFLTKYTLAYAILPLTFGAFLVYALRKPFRETVSLVFAGLVAAGIVGAFFLFVYLQTGNPTFPYFNSIFKSPFFKFEEMENPHLGFIDWRLFWVMTLDAPKYSVVGAVMGSLGIGFWFAFMSILRTVPTVFSNARLVLWPIFTAVVFVTASILMSAIENGDRYIIPILVMAIPMLAWAIKSQKIVSPLVLSLGLLLAQFSYVEQWGYGAGGLDIKQISKPSHSKNVDITRPRQYVSDRLSSDFENMGNILAFGDDGGTQGNVYLIGWYDMPAREEIYHDLKSEAFAEKFKAYIDRKNIDAVRYSPSAFTHLETLDQALFFKTLNELSESWDVISDTYVWYIKPETRFDKVVPMTISTDPDYGYISASIGEAGIVQAELSVSCIGPGIVLNFISDEGWKNVQTEKFICDGTPHRLRSPLIDLKRGEFYYQFRDFESLEIHSAMAGVR